MTSTVHRSIIVPAALVEQARELAAALAPAGDGMFLRALSPTGAAPATHYISAGWIDAAFVEVMASGADLHFVAALYADMAGRPLAATLDDALALVAQSDVSEEDGFAAVDRLGLNFVSDQQELNP